MPDAPQQLLRARAERVVATTRVALSVVVLLSIWIDPSAPANYAGLTYTLHIIYVSYAVALALFTWRRGLAGPLPAVTHAIDILSFLILQFLTLGSSSPLFIYFIFVLFSATIRWGWRGTLVTTPPLFIAYVVMGIWMSRTLPSDTFEMNRFLIRVGYLIMVAGLLVYLGRHEARLREELEQLARWPALAEGDQRTSISLMLAHAASIVGAASAVAAWETEDEPRTTVASWTPVGTSLETYSPDELDTVAPDSQANTSFVVTGTNAPAIVKSGSELITGRAPELHPRIAERLRGSSIASAPFGTERVSGRLFFAGVQHPSASLLPVVELVTREFGASVDQFAIRARQRQLAIGEDRVRVARDLHDGVLQALTGIRLEMQGIATTVGEGPATHTRDRLLALERAIAIEQRELRRFIEGLRPFVRTPPASGGLPLRLEDLRERIALQWKVPIDVRVGAPLRALPPELEAAVPQMVHEAVINALKHGQPSRISVDLREQGDALVVSVSDDGRGFPLHGRFDRQALIERGIAPRSLCERVASLGGDVTIESAATGARVDITLPLARTVA
jgi:signal transduction histidine kinase